MRPWTLVLIGFALVAAGVRAALAPFPGLGGNPALDMIADCDPGLHTAIHVWDYVAPDVAALLAGSFGLSASRVWLQPRAKRSGRGKLPAWPASPEDDAPSIVVGELHHPTVPTESERPSWLVIPEKGLYTGVLIVGSVGTVKTTACMYPFAQQLLSWQADDPSRRAGALVLEVKGDLCPTAAPARRGGGGSGQGPRLGVPCRCPAGARVHGPDGDTLERSPGCGVRRDRARRLDHSHPPDEGEARAPGSPVEAGVGDLR